MHETLLNSLYQLLHIKCFDWLIQTGLELFDLATGVTGLIFFLSTLHAKKNDQKKTENLQPFQLGVVTENA